ncbi:helicase [Dehalococcoides mccartyi]|uniref:DEAD/DEAH box helicase n=1 Tax=Dehalococcoides mccartyi TaxID=61435 RepID=UPI00071E469D|nr:DEAD/DEAH box helicase [Dehalococcoides mccartyi]KSV16611.1 helicase [Dehalococcoides mccartyi]
MLPSILARQLQQGLADYIDTTFPMTNPAFKGSLQKMLNTDDSVFHEPYVAVRLPFRVAEDSPFIFSSIHTSNKPYVHQQKAFERLTGEDGRSTLIATGTGSGKTECFLYPILEYCYRHRGEAGIKALIIYPMNALATDQAKRIAELIHNSPELHGNVTAGMYIGGYESSPSRLMSEDKIVTDHETMLSSPPDILLTNYKMLDYLLVRPKDASLWQENRPETLKYIVVDELHTFDGAQGTDLACLLRRLKARLYTPQGYLCCVGTSATMGAKDSAAGIREYAKDIFGEAFEDESVITEDRLSADEFFNGHEATDFTLPTRQQIDQLLECVENDDQAAYLVAAARCWFDNSLLLDKILSDEARLDIGKRLMVHSFTQSLLQYMGDKYVQPSHICEDLKTRFPQLEELSQPEAAIDALLALISHARNNVAGTLRPFLTVQIQIWLRELRRLLAKVSSENVIYALATDLNEVQSRQYLPVVNCRDCGETGWASIANERGNLTMINLDTFYNLYFKQDHKIMMLYPHSHDDVPSGLAKARLCPNCLQLDLSDGTRQRCPECGTETFPVVFPTNNVAGSGPSREYICPFCGSRGGLSIIGLRSATEISAEVSQLYSSRFNDDKKLLAFSDNVQDAAHRAGFFNSRTWRFGIRSAIQHFALDEGNGLSLAVFSDRFVEYWHRQKTDEEFISFFIAPNMTWMRAYEKMKSEDRLDTGPEANALMRDVERRIKYEIMLEYGVSSRIGRTLEKSGCSVIGFNRDAISDIANTVKLRIVNELNTLASIEEAVFHQMVAGFLYLMRINGAFHDSVFYPFTNNEGKGYLLSNDRVKWLPGFRSGRNVPRFIYEQTGNGRRLWAFDAISENSRYTNWVAACVEEALINKELSQAVANIILNELAKAKLIIPLPSPAGYNIWGLDKQKVFVSNEVEQFVCDVCGLVISIPAGEADIWETAPCQRSKCGGHIHLNKEASLGYYGKLYSTGDMVRVIAKEHTGLLERDDREELERVFKRGLTEKKPWDANLLSCTPTLEMGIDIGDLSTVVLCSIPPAQAQFLQRTGRAGRKDGNALTIAVANARPHDLYFYTDPLEMISGSVEPPKIFLNASAVLERQFVAYCMDCWIKHGAREKDIPKTVGFCLSKLHDKPQDYFPFNFLLFVQNNLTSLQRTFVQLFTNDLDASSVSELSLFAQGNKLKESPMHMKILEAFEGLKKQRDALTGSIKQLQTMIKEIESKPRDSSYEEEIKELKSERAALLSVVRNLNKKDVFNFLSDDGLLPNYAFPEAGIVLKAVLYRKDDNPDAPDASSQEEKKRKYEKMVYEYSRSASSAISEFAPANNFYAGGRKLYIDQVDLVTAQTARWRLCPNCSHAQIEAGKDVASCPQCGTPAWADAGQVRTMLKVQMVYSNMDYTSSLISDESDDRNSLFYCKQMLVDVDEDKDITKACRMDNDEYPFGYEFVKKATIREINFGESDIVGERLTISGTEDIRKGFKICKYCGKIQPEKGGPAHTYTCAARNFRLPDATPFEECLFLYREFVTEALRILVPATTMDVSKVRQESFIAAFMLGMKEYFGNVDHLRACISEVPVPDADYRKQYLVVYDSVPGGTGYLKQLLQRKNSLIEIFEKALAVMENCECKNDQQKDGCYHCLYAYRQSQNIGQISRTTAIQLLKQILKGKDNIQEIDKLGNVPVNSLFESELERRFIEALSQLGNDNRKLEISKALVHSKEGYLLKVGDCSWEIEPQVELDELQGVPVKSRADFILWPVRPSSGQKPIAVFTDGFLYHKDKVADDTLKREAIIKSGRFRVWTFSWKDVQNVFHAQGDYATPTLIPEKMPSGARVYHPTVEAGNAQKLQPDKDKPFDLFAQYLENQNAELLFAVHARAFALSLLDVKLLNNGIAFADWNSRISPVISALDMCDTPFDLSNCMFGKWMPRPDNGHLMMLAGIAASEFKSQKANALPLVCSILDDVKETRSDTYESEWNGFWQFFNVMQFSSNFAAVSTTGVKQMVYDAIPINLSALPQAAKPAAVTDEKWSNILEQMFDDAAKECARKMIDLKISTPSAVGFELVNSVGAVIAECELAWEELKIALLLPSQIDNRASFESNGWKVITIEDTFSSDMFKGGPKL